MASLWISRYIKLGEDKRGKDTRGDLTKLKKTLMSKGTDQRSISGLEKLYCTSTTGRETHKPLCYRAKFIVQSSISIRREYLGSGYSDFSWGYYHP